VIREEIITQASSFATVVRGRRYKAEAFASGVDKAVRNEELNPALAVGFDNHGGLPQLERVPRHGEPTYTSKGARCATTPAEGQAALCFSRCPRTRSCDRWRRRYARSRRCSICATSDRNPASSAIYLKGRPVGALGSIPVCDSAICSNRSSAFASSPMVAQFRAKLKSAAGSLGWGPQRNSRSTRLVLKHDSMIVVFSCDSLPIEIFEQWYRILPR
jgi:hypothetical protein